MLFFYNSFCSPSVSDVLHMFALCTTTGQIAFIHLVWTAFEGIPQECIFAFHCTAVLLVILCKHALNWPVWPLHLATQVNKGQIFKCKTCSGWKVPYTCRNCVCAVGFSKLCLCMLGHDPAVVLWLACVLHSQHAAFSFLTWVLSLVCVLWHPAVEPEPLTLFPSSWSLSNLMHCWYHTI